MRSKSCAPRHVSSKRRWPTKGLIRKDYLNGDAGTGGVYLWDSRASAEARFTEDRIVELTKRFGVRPVLTWYDTHVTVDNLKGGQRQGARRSGLNGWPSNVPAGIEHGDAWSVRDLRPYLVWSGTLLPSVTVTTVGVIRYPPLDHQKRSSGVTSRSNFTGAVPMLRTRLKGESGSMTISRVVSTPVVRPRPSP